MVTVKKFAPTLLETTKLIYIETIVNKETNSKVNKFKNLKFCLFNTMNATGKQNEMEFNYKDNSRDYELHFCIFTLCTDET